MIHVLDDGRIAVVVNGRRWIYCRECLLPVAEDHVYNHEEGVNTCNGWIYSHFNMLIKGPGFSLGF